jgi:hypothetical protein
VKLVLVHSPLVGAASWAAVASPGQSWGGTAPAGQAARRRELADAEGGLGSSASG